jgi:hypothetical protein
MLGLRRGLYCVRLARDDLWRQDCGMSKGALIDWKDECKAIHTEMDNLLKAGGPGWPGTSEERRIRRVQFMPLIERRDAAARKLLSDKQEGAGLGALGRNRTSLRNSLT